MQRWHVVFSGRVQHVGFRYTSLYIARSLYLTGWVRNLKDGRVEIDPDECIRCRSCLGPCPAVNFRAADSDM